MSDMDEDEALSDAEGEEEEVVNEGGGEEEEEEEEQFKGFPLTQETISQGLSLLCRTEYGLGHAFVKLDLRNKGLNDITAIGNYIHIRFLDVSNNYLADLSPLVSLTQLLWLKVDNNAMACLEGQPFDQLTYLQWLSMAGNRLTDVEGLVAPTLESLSLTGNNIQRMKAFQSGCFSNLVTLEIRGNKLDTTAAINLPNLQKLFLAQNVINRLEGLQRLQRLVILHLRDNQLESMDGISPCLKCLRYLNVRGNSIGDVKALQCLGLLSETLKALVLSDNPLVELSDYRLNVLMLLPQLDRLDKDPVSLEERVEAEDRIRELNEEETPEPKDL
ncbi:leucine-rich repeat-containing protein 23 isoform X1 [Embiotoca jacksoni]|uniref:leucine-rich repeat-containing protein 23 isoform X1 n=1 Tax=Embiotoca jacksoni TaxID=100190 RepID=UPI00370470AC